MKRRDYFARHAAMQNALLRERRPYPNLAQRKYYVDGWEQRFDKMLLEEFNGSQEKVELIKEYYIGKKTSYALAIKYGWGYSYTRMLIFFATRRLKEYIKKR